jgi:AraC-like DNA-binding protein
MRIQCKRAEVSTNDDAPTPPARKVIPAPPARLDSCPQRDPLLQRRYRELSRKHLNGLMHRLFAEFTGLHFRIAWAPSLPHDWTAVTLATGCAACREFAGNGNGNDEYCRTCGAKHLARALRATNKGHRFNCRLGVRNHWFPITVRGVTVGLACLQALAGNRSRRTFWRRSSRSMTKAVTRADFHRAARLLRLMVQHAQALDLAELRLADLTCARHAVTVLESERSHLRQELRHLIPTTARTPPAAGPENHTEQVVHAALAIVNQQYSQSITLKQCARSLGLNAAYLSALFSRAVGLRFKSYLTELRLQKARLLLADPNRRVSEVAAAVGYTSDNRFRIAFRQATGFSPTTWRETFHAVGPFLLELLIEDLDFIESLQALIPF